MSVLLAKAISMSCVTMCVCGLYMFCMCVHMYMLLCVYMFMKPRVWHQKCCPFSLCVRTPSWTCHSLIWLSRLGKQPQRSIDLAKQACQTAPEIHQSSRDPTTKCYDSDLYHNHRHSEGSGNPNSDPNVCLAGKLYWLTHLSSSSLFLCWACSDYLLWNKI